MTATRFPRAAGSKRISVPQIRAHTDWQVTELIRGGEDPFVYARQRQPDGSVARAPVFTTFVGKRGRYEATYPDLKRKQCFTAVEWQKLKKLGPEVRAYCQDLRNLWWGTANGGLPCLASEVGERTAQITERLRRFFENSSQPVELLLSVAHQDEISTVNSAGRALLHVHVHFMFRWGGDREQLRKLIRGFRKRFPIGGRIMPVRHTGRVISYTFRTPNLQPLHASGDYLDWARSVTGRRRISCYGGLRAARGAWKRARLVPVQISSFAAQTGRWNERYNLRPKPHRLSRRGRTGSAVIEPNTAVGDTVIKTRRGKVAAVIVKNAQRAGVVLQPLCSQYGTLNSLLFRHPAASQGVIAPPPAHCSIMTASRETTTEGLAARAPSYSRPPLQSATSFPSALRAMAPPTLRQARPHAITLVRSLALKALQVGFRVIRTFKRSRC